MKIRRSQAFTTIRCKNSSDLKSMIPRHGTQAAVEIAVATPVDTVG